MRFRINDFLAFAALVIAGITAQSAAAQNTPSAQKSCEVPRAVTSNLTLTPDCVYQGMFLITASNVTLDCRGARIDATSSFNGIRIKGPGLRNIKILNCRIEGAKAQGLMIQQPTDDVTMAALPKDQRYQEGVQGVTVRNVSISKSGSVGLYVDSYTQDAVLDNVTISQSGGAGMYLEHSSVRTSVLNSAIIDNGFGDPLGRRKKGMSREGIAIDSSAYNIVKNTTFRGNSAGGIFLYKNCWDNYSKGNTVARWLHSSYNTIEGNSFTDEKIGIWVASRQTSNVSRWDCGDPAIAPGYYRDRADNNTVVGNTFNGGLVGLRIDDDFTIVKNNKFISPDRDCVQLGSLVRDKVVKAPVSGTELSGNSCLMGSPGARSQDPDSSNGFRAIGVSRFAACNDNSVNGTVAACKR